MLDSSGVIAVMATIYHCTPEYRGKDPVELARNLFVRTVAECENEDGAIDGTLAASIARWRDAIRDMRSTISASPPPSQTSDAPPRQT